MESHWISVENFSCFPHGILWGIKPGPLFCRIAPSLKWSSSRNEGLGNSHVTHVHGMCLEWIVRMTPRVNQTKILWTLSHISLDSCLHCSAGVKWKWTLIMEMDTFSSVLGNWISSLTHVRVYLSCWTFFQNLRNFGRHPRISDASSQTRNFHISSSKCVREKFTENFNRLSEDGGKIRPPQQNQWGCGAGAETMKGAPTPESRHMALTPTLRSSVTPLTVGSFSKLYQTHFLVVSHKMFWWDCFAPAAPWTTAHPAPH